MYRSSTMKLPQNKQQTETKTLFQFGWLEETLGLTRRRNHEFDALIPGLPSSFLRFDT
jgi:hypothetical protein